MWNIRTLVVLIALLSVCVLSLARPAPYFALQGNHGMISLDSLRGHVVYLDFWASWCDPCRKSFPWMEDLQRKYADKGLLVVAVNLDANSESADKFLAKHPVDFAVVFDPSGSVAKAYELKGMPSSYIIDQEGNVVSTHIGFQEKDAKTLENQLVELLGP
jgi:thiol-disulfide isomerase/thioredoxin